MTSFNHFCKFAWEQIDEAFPTILDKRILDKSHFEFIVGSTAINLYGLSSIEQADRFGFTFPEVVEPGGLADMFSDRFRSLVCR